MPKTNDFKSKEQQKAKHAKHSKKHSENESVIPDSNTEHEARRPGLEVNEFSSEEVVIEAPAPEQQVQDTLSAEKSEPTQNEYSSEDTIQDEGHDKVNFKFNFIGADLVRAKLPKTVNFAEKLTNDWMKDGDFNDLPVDQPLIQYYMGAGLRKAKQTEKEILQKVEASNVVPLAKMVAETVLAKIFKK